MEIRPEYRFGIAYLPDADYVTALGVKGSEAMLLFIPDQILSTEEGYEWGEIVYFNSVLYASGLLLLGIASCRTAAKYSIRGDENITLP